MSEVVSRLEEKGFSCWIAPRDVQGGSPWGRSIVHAIEACDVFTLLLTKRSNRSRQVLHEVERAMSKDKALLPVKLDPCDVGEHLELYLGAVHWVEAMGFDAEQIAEVVIENAQRRSGLAPLAPGRRGSPWAKVLLGLALLAAVGVTSKFAPWSREAAAPAFADVLPAFRFDETSLYWQPFAKTASLDGATTRQFSPSPDVIRAVQETPLPGLLQRMPSSLPRLAEEVEQIVGVPIVVDLVLPDVDFELSDAAEMLGLGTYKPDEITAAQLLDAICEFVPGMAWTIVRDGVWITTPQRAALRAVAFHHFVGDLVAAEAPLIGSDFADRQPAWPTLERLEDVTTTAADTSEVRAVIEACMLPIDARGRAVGAMSQGDFVQLQHDPEVHAAIHHLLMAWREGAGLGSSDDLMPLRLLEARADERNAEAAERLARLPIVADFHDTPIEEYVDFLTQMTGLDYRWSANASDAVMNSDFAMRAPLMSALEVLDLLQRDNQDLSWTLDDGKIVLVDVIEEEWEADRLWVHDVRGLLARHEMTGETLRSRIVRSMGTPEEQLRADRALWVTDEGLLHALMPTWAQHHVQGQIDEFRSGD